MTEVLPETPPPGSVRLEAVSRSFGAVKAVDNVSFDVWPGEAHALCGHNGAGKSTVVKMLSGLLKPDQGRILIDGRPVEFDSPQDAQASGNALVDQELSVVPALTVLDNVLLGSIGEPLFSRRGQAVKRVKELLDQVGLNDVDPSDYVEDLPIGHRQLVEIARALGRDAQLLILDEPTATLSGSEIEHVFAAVRKVTGAGRSVIFVSHRLNEVMELCSRVTVLRDGKHIGTASTADIEVRDLVEMMLGHPHVDQPGATVRGDDGRPVVLRVEDFSAGGVARDFNLEGRSGVVYGLAGQVGSGASEVLRGLAGLEPDANGRVDVGEGRLRLGMPGAAKKAGIAYLSNDRKEEGLYLGHSIQDNLVSTRLDKFSRFGVLRRRPLRSEAKSLAETIGIAPDRLGEAVQLLSGGNQQKVLLGRYIDRTDTRVLLLDEPTRGVDVKGRAEIHSLVRRVAETGTCVLFASTELDEIFDLSDIIITMRGGAVISTRLRDQASAHDVVADMTHTDIGVDI